MNPAAILGLIADLYAQIQAQADTIAKLEAALAAKDANG